MKILIVEDNVILSKNISKFFKIKKIENSVCYSAE
jgi:DNA-binding response OmpR family regulator